MILSTIIMAFLSAFFGSISFLFANYPKLLLIGLVGVLIICIAFYFFIIKPNLSTLKTMFGPPLDPTYNDGRNKNYTQMYSSNDKDEEEGIGGMKLQLEEIYKQVTLPREIDPILRAKLKQKQVKGIILHGPPGTGKTLLARNLARKLGCSEPAKMSASTLIDKYYGESERKLRELFVHPPERLHMVILDEIESICPIRSSGMSDSKFYTALTNQLLSLMDGLDSDPNVLVIGTTNNIKAIDPAILRPGRFDMHLDINPPNREGREEIVKIYTDHLINDNLMENYNMEDFLNKTDNHTGADIADTVRKATTTALYRHVKNKEPFMITENDIHASIINKTIL